MPVHFCKQVVYLPSCLKFSFRNCAVHELYTAFVVVVHCTSQNEIPWGLLTSGAFNMLQL